MSELFFTLAEAARLVEVNARKLAAELEDHDYRLVRYRRNFYEVLYKLKDFWPQESKLYYYDHEIKKMFILSDGQSRSGTYAFTIAEAVCLTGKSRSWVWKLNQSGKITQFKGRRIKDANIKTALVSVDALKVLGLDFKPDDMFKLFTLNE